MENEDFKKIWAMLNRRYKEAGGVGTIGTDLAPAGICTFAEKIKRELDEFVGEVIARAKAADDNAASMALHNQEAFGERYANAVPEFRYGLKFADQEPI
jgi:hypothetical protein